jgi:putative endonuclease
MGYYKQETGNWGEQIATNYLTQKGYRIIGRNIRTPHGEIDILASYNQVLIFIEVKIRTNKSFGNPENSITSQKLIHMDESAQYYTQIIEHDGTWQWDAISILKLSSNSHELIHFENVIS